jgi:two-component system chemotaxis response regulator CheY
MSKRALVVDDSKTMRDMVAFTLKNAGFEIVLAEDGVQALTAASSTKVDIVVTDLNMPNMNGIEFIKALRLKPEYAYIPILMLTTESDGFKKLEGKNAGATGWIVKPFNPERLIQVINKVCVS